MITISEYLILVRKMNNYIFAISKNKIEDEVIIVNLSIHLI